MRFRFGRKYLLSLWLVSLLEDCAWAFPAVSPLVRNYQYPAYADVWCDDTATPDMSIHRNSASYEATRTHTRPPFIASVGEMPPRLRVAHKITAARNNKTSSGVTTLAHGEVLSPRLERSGNGIAAAIMGANGEERLGDDRTTQFILIQGGLENRRLTSERLGIRRSDNPEAFESSYTPTRARVEHNAWEAVKGTRIVRNEKAVLGPTTYGSEALQHKSEFVEAGIIRDSDIPVNPKGAPANLSTKNEGVVPQEVQHHCAATSVDSCIPGFFLAQNREQSSGRLSRILTRAQVVAKKQILK